jgi:hypothetical protein
MSKTTTALGREWRRIDIPGYRESLLESIDRIGAPVRISEDRLRRIGQERQAHAEANQRARTEAAREQAAFLAKPRVEIDGIEWVRFDDEDPRLLMNLGRTAVVKEATLREAQRLRVHEAEQQKVLTDREEIDELKRQLAALTSA